MCTPLRLFPRLGLHLRGAAASPMFIILVLVYDSRFVFGVHVSCLQFMFYLIDMHTAPGSNSYNCHIHDYTHSLLGPGDP